MKNSYIDSKFDDFLEQDSVLNEVSDLAMKKAQQIYTITALASSLFAKPCAMTLSASLSSPISLNVQSGPFMMVFHEMHI